VAHERACVDAFDRDDVPAFQIRLETFLGAPVGDDPAGLAHDEALDPRAHRFSVGFVDAVVADQRISHADDLACVGRIGENFLVAGHRSVEDHLAANFTLRGPRPTTKRTTVFKCEKCLAFIYHLVNPGNPANPV